MKRRAFLLTPLALASGRLLAQTTGVPLRVVVPAREGSGADVIARLLADKLKGIYAPAVEVENAAEGGGRAGVETVRGAAPDGRTLLFTPDFPITVYPSATPKPSYDPLQDFTPIAMVVRSPAVLVAGPGLPSEVKTLKDFVAWAKANPQRAVYAPLGTAQLAAPLLGVKLQRRGKLKEVVDGAVPVAFGTLGDLVADLRAGNLRALAVSGAKRAGLMPSVPSMAEAGFPDVNVAPWLGFFAPARTPADIVRRLANAIADASGYGAVQQEFFKLGFDPVAMTPIGFANVVKADLERWAPLVKASGFSAEG